MTPKKWIYADKIPGASYYYCPACAPHSNAKIPAECIERYEEIRCDLCNAEFLASDEAYQIAYDKAEERDKIPLASRKIMEREALRRAKRKEEQERHRENCDYHLIPYRKPRKKK